MCDVNDERTVIAYWGRDGLERAILDALAAAGIYEEGENMPKMWRVCK
jgi:hypothetical protein